MADGFGAYTDHFGLESSDLVVVDCSKVPRPLSRDDAEDENGDLAKATWFGNTAGEIYDVSTTYELKSGTLDLSTLFLGELSSGVFAASMVPSTGNKLLPRIVVTGVLGIEDIVAPTGYTNTFAMPAITLTAIKQAQLLDFTVDAGCRLTGSSISASVDLAEFPDGVGEPHAHGVSGGIATLDADFVRITAACAWTPGTIWDETQAPGEEEGQNTHHTGKGTAEAILTRVAV